MIDQGFEFIWTDQKSIIKHKPSQKAREGNGGGQGIIVLKTKEILFFCNVMFQNTVTLGNNDKLSYLIKFLSRIGKIDCPISICEKCGPPPIKWLQSRFTTGLV